MQNAAGDVAQAPRDQNAACRVVVSDLVTAWSSTFRTVCG